MRRRVAPRAVIGATSDEPAAPERRTAPPGGRSGLTLANGSANAPGCGAGTRTPTTRARIWRAANYTTPQREAKECSWHVPSGAHANMCSHGPVAHPTPDPHPERCGAHCRESSASARREIGLTGFRDLAADIHAGAPVNDPKPTRSGLSSGEPSRYSARRCGGPKRRRRQDAQFPVAGGSRCVRAVAGRDSRSRFSSGRRDH